MNVRAPGPLVFAIALTSLGCGSNGDAGPASDDAATSEVIDDAIVAEAETMNGDSSTPIGDSARLDSAITPSGDAALDAPDPTLPVAPMPLISGGVPAFSSAASSSPSSANDTNPASAWGTSSTAAWIAYDLSAVPVAQRRNALVAWDAIHAGCYIDTASTSGQRPLAYTIETNAAPSGASAPTTGWTTLQTIVGNRYCARQHTLDLSSANWIRLNVSSSTPDGIALDFSVYSAPDGATDSWLFMGDSITYMTMTYACSDLPAQVHAVATSHWPAVLDAAIGGTNTSTALTVIDDTMKDFPGRFVVLAYGTNDHATDFHMKELVAHVIAAGKTPVVPHMPWSQGSPEGVQINALIDALYAAEPAIVRGPDLWRGLEGHTEWIPVGDIHPNAAGQTEIRREWSLAMAATYR